ncbi:hypothetical protein V6N12_050081 [Hibiscus sabdariffa]|uniref:Uncharacterized protein n=1 Tax=Hibiscus sabdariffa TaxID=183260 RepID=A0ABR2GBX9_9ROSI
MLAAYVVEFLRLMGADDSGTRRDFIDGDIPLPSGCLILHWTDFVCAWRVYSRASTNVMQMIKCKIKQS